MKKTIGNVDDPLKLVPAVALLGGSALYLLSHIAFRYRNIRTINRQRLVVAMLSLALIPLAVEISALATLAILTGVMVCLIAYETVRFSEMRDRIRHRLEADPT